MDFLYHILTASAFIAIVAGCLCMCLLTKQSPPKYRPQQPPYPAHLEAKPPRPVHKEMRHQAFLEDLIHTTDGRIVCPYCNYKMFLEATGFRKAPGDLQCPDCTQITEIL